MRFIGRDLKNRIARSVDNRPSSLDVFLAQLFDNFRPGSMAITKNAGQIAFFDKRVNQLGGKARRAFWKHTPVKLDRQAHHFPMAAWRILTETFFRREPVCASEARRLFQRKTQPRCFMGQSPKAEAQKVRNAQWSGAQARFISVAFGAGERNMSKSVRANIAEFFSVIRGANTEGVEYADNCASHLNRLSFRK